MILAPQSEIDVFGTACNLDFRKPLKRQSNIINPTLATASVKPSGCRPEARKEGEGARQEQPSFFEKIMKALAREVLERRGPFPDVRTDARANSGIGVKKHDGTGFLIETTIDRQEKNPPSTNLIMIRNPVDVLDGRSVPNEHVD